MPATRSAAATVSPANACAEWPSIVKGIGSPAASGSLWNMKPPGTERKKLVGKLSGRDLRRDVEGLVCRQRYAGVARCEECARMCRGLIVNREAVLAHHAQRRPSAYDIEPGEHREQPHRATRLRGDNPRRHDRFQYG